MLIKEIINEIEILDEEASVGTRYNSELGLLFGLIGDTSIEFDPMNPEQSIPASRLSDTRTYAAIKKEASWFRPEMFYNWAKYAPRVRALVETRQPFPSKISWVGTNSSGSNPSDIHFGSGPTYGISLKAEGENTFGGVDLATFGIVKPRGPDMYMHYAQDEWVYWKTAVFNMVLDLAEDRPDQEWFPRTNAVRQGHNDDFIKFDSGTKTFTCSGRGKTFSGTRDQIISAATKKNADWQSPFGSWATDNKKSIRHLSTPLFTKISQIVVLQIEEALQDSAKLMHAFRVADKPLFLLKANTGKMYYVPASDDLADSLELKGPPIYLANSTGIGQRFEVRVGRKDSDSYASVDIVFQYVKTFTANPIVQIQRMRNPENLGWEIIGSISG